MKAINIAILVLIGWAFGLTFGTIAQDGPAYGLAAVVEVSSEQDVVIGNGPVSLSTLGIAYYEVFDDLGFLDSGFLFVLEYGSFNAFLARDKLQNSIGNPFIILYDPFSDMSNGPVQVSFLMTTNSVTATFARLMASGNVAEIRAFISLMEETGQLTALQISQIRARLLAVQAIEAAAISVATEAEAVLAYGGPAAFSRLIGMGVGRQVALDRAAAITLAEIQTARVTLPVARYWRNSYQRAVANGKGGDTAPARVLFFERIIALLGG